MGGFWEECFLRKAQEPARPKPGFPEFRVFALHSSATLRSAPELAYASSSNPLAQNTYPKTQITPALVLQDRR